MRLRLKEVRKEGETGRREERNGIDEEEGKSEGGMGRGVEGRWRGRGEKKSQGEKGREGRVERM
jgi:hypothetical protein